VIERLRAWKRCSAGTSRSGTSPTLAVFWKDADFSAYMALYERTARTIKDVDSSLKVGGPATRGPGRRPARLRGAAFPAGVPSTKPPIDFFSTTPTPRSTRSTSWARET